MEERHSCSQRQGQRNDIAVKNAKLRNCRIERDRKWAGKIKYIHMRGMGRERNVPFILVASARQLSWIRDEHPTHFFFVWRTKQSYIFCTVHSATARFRSTSMQLWELTFFSAATAWKKQKRNSKKKKQTKTNSSDKWTESEKWSQSYGAHKIWIWNALFWNTIFIYIRNAYVMKCYTVLDETRRGQCIRRFWIIDNNWTWCRISQSPQNVTSHWCNGKGKHLSVDIGQCIW